MGNFKKVFFVVLIFMGLFEVNDVFCQTLTIGPLQITAINANIHVRGINNPDEYMLIPTVKLLVKNTSSSDLQVIFIQNSISGYDALNQKIFRENGDFFSSGIPMSSNFDDSRKVFFNDKGKFVTMSSEQQMQTFVDVPENGGQTLYDKSHDFPITHKPETMTFNGSIGIIYLDNKTEIRAFSFIDIPITWSYTPL